MLVGLAYDLLDDYSGQGFTPEELAEFDRPGTIAAIEDALSELGHHTDRIGNIKALVGRLAAGERWDMVFNIAEGLYGLGREAQVPALLDAYRIPYTFSDPLVMALTLHKGMTKHVFRSGGVPTPAFAVVNSLQDLKGIKLPLPLFVKPAAEGTGKGITDRSRVSTRAELKDLVVGLLERHSQPVLVETYLDGREFTVGIVGDGTRPKRAICMEIAFKESSPERIYSYEVKEDWKRHLDYVLADSASAGRCIDVSVKAWERLGLRDAARVDIRMDDRGNPFVLEVNPLPGLNPTHSDLPILWNLYGKTYTQLIGEIVASCGSRLA